MRILSQRPGEVLCVIKENTPEWVDVETVDEVEFQQPLENYSIPVIKNIESWIEEGTPFSEDL